MVSGLDPSVKYNSCHISKKGVTNAILTEPLIAFGRHLIFTSELDLIRQHHGGPAGDHVTGSLIFKYPSKPVGLPRENLNFNYPFWKSMALKIVILNFSLVMSY